MESTYASIARLVFTYAALLDEGDLAGMAALFADATFRSSTPDGEFTLTGPAEIEAAFRSSTRLFPDGTPGTLHVTTNLMLEESDSPDEVRSQAYFTVLQSTPALALQVVVAGRYRDRFVRRDGRWHFADRFVTITRWGDTREHLMIDRPDAHATASQ